MGFEEWWESFWEPSESFASVNLKDIARAAWDAAEKNSTNWICAESTNDNKTDTTNNKGCACGGEWRCSSAS